MVGKLQYIISVLQTRPYSAIQLPLPCYSDNNNNNITYSERSDLYSIIFDSRSPSPGHAYTDDSDTSALQ